MTGSAINTLGVVVAVAVGGTSGVLVGSSGRGVAGTRVFVGVALGGVVAVAFGGVVAVALGGVVAVVLVGVSVAGSVDVATAGAAYVTVLCDGINSASNTSIPAIALKL